MTCADCRELLPLHLYGDLTDTDRAAVDAHVSDCPACGAELAALSRTRSALNIASLPNVGVDLNRLHRAETARHRRAAWRWRVAALAGLAAAVLVLVSRLDVRVDARQLVLRWGPPEPVVAPPPPTHVPSTVIVQKEMVSPPEWEEHLNILTALIHALAANVESGDRERAAELARLHRELAGLRRQGDQRWTETERTVSALYTAQFGSRTQGDKP